MATYTHSLVRATADEPVGRQCMWSKRHLAILIFLAEARIIEKKEAYQRRFWRRIKSQTALRCFSNSFLRRMFLRHAVKSRLALLKVLLMLQRFIQHKIITPADFGSHPMYVKYFTRVMKPGYLPCHTYISHVFFPQTAVSRPTTSSSPTSSDSSSINPSPSPSSSPPPPPKICFSLRKRWTTQPPFDAAAMPSSRPAPCRSSNLTPTQ